MKTFSSDAPWPTGPLRPASKFTEPEKGFSVNGRNTGLRFCCADARALVNSRKVCDDVPEDR